MDEFIYMCDGDVRLLTFVPVYDLTFKFVCIVYYQIIQCWKKNWWWFKGAHKSIHDVLLVTEIGIMFDDEYPKWHIMILWWSEKAILFHRWQQRWFNADIWFRKCFSWLYNIHFYIHTVNHDSTIKFHTMMTACLT